MRSRLCSKGRFQHVEGLDKLSASNSGPLGAEASYRNEQDNGTWHLLIQQHNGILTHNPESGRALPSLCAPDD